MLDLARTSLLGALVLAFAAVACSGSDDAASSGPGYATGPNMFPGVNCLSCHAVGFGDDAPTWSAGGTLFEAKDSDVGVEGAIVTITDTNGKSDMAMTSASGNFHFPEGLEPPFKVTVEYDGETIEMPGEAPAGSCNACHKIPDPLVGAPGRMFPSQGKGDWMPMATQ